MRTHRTGLFCQKYMQSQIFSLENALRDNFIALNRVSGLSERSTNTQAQPSRAQDFIGLCRPCTATLSGAPHASHKLPVEISRRNDGIDAVGLWDSPKHEKLAWNLTMNDGTSPTATVDGNKHKQFEPSSMSQEHRNRTSQPARSNSYLDQIRQSPDNSSPSDYNRWLPQAQLHITSQLQNISAFKHFSL